MNLHIKLIFAALLLLNVSSTFAQEKLLISGCGNNDLRIIEKKTQQIVWKHLLGKGEESNDAEITKKGNVLYAYKKGARLISFKNQTVIWDFKALPGEEVFTATELKNGNYLVAMCGRPSRIIELNPQGDSINVLRLNTGINSVHGQFRQITPTDRSTYLIAYMDKGEVVEISKKGDLLKTIKVGGNPFAVKILKNGNWLVACGDASKFVEVDPKQGKIIKTTDNSSLTDAKMLFVAEVCQLKNGNLLIANWEGHTKDTAQYKMFEIDKNNKIVWGIKNCYVAKKVSTIYVFNKKL
jgi:uncharacterized protein YjiK